LIDLTIIISCFNNRHIIDKTLDSTFRSIAELEKQGKTAEVIVFDNASTDGSASFINKNYPQVKLVENQENIGFSKGNNSTRPFASGKYILFLNGDTEFGSDVFVVMLDYMQNNSNIGVSTCKIDLYSGGLDKDCRRGEMTLWTTFSRLSGLWKLAPESKFLNSYYYGYIPDTVEHEVMAVQGAFLLTTKKLADKINWWDEDYFLNGEDLDFCKKIRDLGYKVMYYPKTHIIHYRGYSKGTRESNVVADSKKSKQIKIMVARASVDSMRIYYKKHIAKDKNFIINNIVYLGLKLLETVRVLKYS